MVDPIMYQEEAYVLLEPDQPEQFITPAELLEKLETVLAATPQDELPPDLQRFSDRHAQATYLMETSCELDVGPGQFLQWYVVRLEK
jgi:hypothetical protein